MTTPLHISFKEAELDALSEATGALAVIVGPDGSLDRLARRVNRLTRKALERLAESDEWEKVPTGGTLVLSYASRVAAERVIALKLPRRVTALEARKAGAALAKAMGKRDLTVCVAGHARAAEIT